MRAHSRKKEHLPFTSQEWKECNERVTRVTPRLLVAIALEVREGTPLHSTRVNGLARVLISQSTAYATPVADCITSPPRQVPTLVTCMPDSISLEQIIK